MPGSSIISGRRGTISKIARGASRIEGLDDIQKRISAVIDSTTGKKAKGVFVDAAIIGRNAIRALAPVKTGRLRRSIFAAAGEEAKANALLGVNYRIAPHAHLVEFGHGGPHPAGPHPYFRPGLTQAAPAMAQAIKQGLTKVIEDAAEGKR